MKYHRSYFIAAIRRGENIIQTDDCAIFCVCANQKSNVKKPDEKKPKDIKKKHPKPIKTGTKTDSRYTILLQSVTINKQLLLCLRM